MGLNLKKGFITKYQFKYFIRNKFIVKSLSLNSKFLVIYVKSLSTKMTHNVSVSDPYHFDSDSDQDPDPDSDSVNRIFPIKCYARL